MDIDDVLRIIFYASDGTWKLDRGAIRLCLTDMMSPDTLLLFCPVTYAAYVSEGVYYELDQWQDAARHIGLDLSIADRIVAAADEPAGAYPEIRQQLLCAAGLDE